MDVYWKAGVLLQFLAMKHGHGTKGATPTSDAAGRKGCRCQRVQPRPAASCHVVFGQF